MSIIINTVGTSERTDLDPKCSIFRGSTVLGRVCWYPPYILETWHPTPGSLKCIRERSGYQEPTQTISLTLLLYLSQSKRHLHPPPAMRNTHTHTLVGNVIEIPGNFWTRSSHPREWSSRCGPWRACSLGGRQEYWRSRVDGIEGWLNEGVAGQGKEPTLSYFYLTTSWMELGHDALK